MGGDVIAGGLNLAAWKGLVEALDFLQADDIRLGFLQPEKQMVQPLTDGIDVPGRDTQWLSPWTA